MPARVTFLLGRSGSGKTRRLHRCIKEALDKGRRVVVIVPEQFTFETERQLASELGGLMDIEVYSFSSLAEKTLEGSYLGFLSRQGRRMAVRKTITEQGSKLRIFARVKDRPGFSERLCELFTACKRYEVAPGDLLEGAEKAEEDKSLLTVTANGYGKRTDIVEYLRLSEDGTRYPQNRGGKGLKNYNITAKTGPVVACRVVGDGEDVILIESGGVIIRMPASDINVYKRDTQGVILMRVEGDSQVIGVEKVDNQEETP